MQPPASARRSPLAAAAAQATVVALVASAALLAGSAAAEDRSVRTLTLAKGQVLAVAVTVGSIRVTGEPGRTEVRLEIARQAPSAAALARVPIVLTEDAAGPRLSIAQAAGGADPAIRTDVVVAAPADVRLDALTIAEGRLELHHLRGAVRATVARGAIAADDVSGMLRLETTIGAIDLTRATLEAAGLFRLRTFNGDVRVGLAAPLTDARIMALALNGTITSAVPLTMKDGWGPRWGEATIGRADRVLSIDVVSGTIRLETPGGR